MNTKEKKQEKINLKNNILKLQDFLEKIDYYNPYYKFDEIKKIYSIYRTNECQHLLNAIKIFGSKKKGIGLTKKNLEKYISSLEKIEDLNLPIKELEIGVIILREHYLFEVIDKDRDGWVARSLCEQRDIPIFESEERFYL